MYNMVDISVETWNKAEISVINIHKNNNANKILLKLDALWHCKKNGVGKIFITWLTKKLKENMGLETWVILQNHRSKSRK